MKNIIEKLTVVSIIAIFAFGVAACPKACTQPDKTTKILTQQGYTNIVITGWRPFSAGEGDSFATGFKATAPNGETVSGVVTGGFLKGATVRFD